MSAIAAAIIGAGVLGAGASIFGSQTAAKAQEQASQNAISEQQQMFNVAQQNEQPFIQAGQNALPSLTSLLTPGPNQNATLQQLPGFQFANTWGQQGVANQGTTTGLGGNTLAAGAQFGTGLAEQSWGTLISQLQGLTNTGANAAAGLGNQAVQTGQGVSGNLVGAGNAAAGAATATGSAIGNIGNSITTAALLQKLTGNNGMFGNQQPLNLGNAGGTSGGLSGLF